MKSEQDLINKLMISKKIMEKQGKRLLSGRTEELKMDTKEAEGRRKKC